jgi:hypothetical protein
MNEISLDTAKEPCSCPKCQNVAIVYLLVADSEEYRSYCEICASHVRHHGLVKEDSPLTRDSPSIEAPRVEKCFCKNGCGTRITFDKNKVSKSKKMIPLELNGIPHFCANAPRTICRYCSCEVSFERPSTGKWVLLNPDGSFHSCPKWPAKKVTNTNEHGLIPPL